jgi:hypothetical protein
VVSQEGDFYIRYHVQDGGSTDSTLDKLAKWDERLATPESGIVSCRGVSFSFSSAPDRSMYEAVDTAFTTMAPPDDSMIGWLNSGDVMMQFACNTVRNAGIGIKDLQWVGGPAFVLMKEGVQVISTMPYPQEIVAAGLCDNKHWPHIQQEGVFFKYGLFLKSGGFDLSLTYAGDYDLWRRMAAHAPFVQLPWPTACFKEAENQLSTRDNGARYNAEVNRIVPERERTRRLKLLTKSKIETLETVCLRSSWKSKRYELIRLLAKDNPPVQASRFFPKIEKPDGELGWHNLDRDDLAGIPLRKRPSFVERIKSIISGKAL